MENEKRSACKNDILSQSYCDGIKRLAGTKLSSEENFSVPTHVIEGRKKYWDSLFRRYSEDASDEFELDLETLQAVEGKVSNPMVERAVEEYSLSRLPMRKPLSLVQHWVNTGSIVHKDLLDGDKCLAISASSTEQDLLKQSVSGKRVGRLNRQNWQVNSGSSSCSSVDTAAYILSNANRTKKAKATALVKGSKVRKKMGSQQVKPSAIDPPVGSGESSEHASNGAVEDRNNNPLESQAEPAEVTPNTELQCDQPIACVPESNVLHNSVLTPDSIGQENNNAQFPNQNITLMESIEKALMHLTSNNMMTPSHSVCSSAKLSSHDEEIFAMDSQTSSVSETELRFHRKKLYSGRDSPVDLMDMRSSIGNRLSQSEKPLHPALDPIVPSFDNSFLKKRKLQASQRRKKWSTLFAKHLIKKSGQGDLSADENSQDSKASEESNTTNENNGRTRLQKRPRKNIVARAIRKFSPMQSPFQRRKNQNRNKGIAKNLFGCDLDPIVSVHRLPDKIVRKYISHSPRLRPGMNPVVNLTQLSDSYVQRHKSQTEETRETRSERRSVERGEKLAEIPIPVDAEYVNSDDNTSESTFTFYRCSHNGNSEISVTDLSCITENSSQDVICNPNSSIPVTNSLITNNLRSNSNNNALFNQLKGKSNQNVQTSSPTKVKAVRRSGKFEITKNTIKTEPVVMLERLPENVISNRKLDAPVKDDLPLRDLRVRFESSEESTVLRDIPNKQKMNEKSSAPLVFKTTLVDENCSDFSDYSGANSVHRRSRRLSTSYGANSNKRNRITSLITLSSDDDGDLDNLIQHLPRKKAKSKSDPNMQNSSNATMNVTKLVHSMEVLSDTTDDADTIKKNRRKVSQQRRNNIKSVVSVADSTTQDNDEKHIRRSKRIEKTARKTVTRNGIKKSSNLASSDRKKRDEENGTKDKLTCTESDANNVSSTQNVERHSSPRSNRRTRAKTNKDSDQLNQKTPSKKSPTKVKHSTTTESSIASKQTRKFSLRFQTRLFDDSDSECQSTSSYSNRSGLG